MPGAGHPPAWMGYIHVVYKGSAPAISDLIAGNVDLMFDNLPSIGPQAKAGNVRGLAVTTKVRSQFAPDYPTIADPFLDSTCRRGSALGFAQARRRPSSMRSRRRQSRRASATTCKKRMAAAWISVVGSDGGSSVRSSNSERKRWGDLIRDLQIKPQ